MKAKHLLLFATLLSAPLLSLRAVGSVPPPVMAAAATSLTYTYDAAGNRTARGTDALLSVPEGSVADSLRILTDTVVVTPVLARP